MRLDVDLLLSLQGSPRTQLQASACLNGVAAGAQVQLVLLPCCWSNGFAISFGIGHEPKHFGTHEVACFGELFVCELRIVRFSQDMISASWALVSPNDFTIVLRASKSMFC
ncbi:unnamed protein product [Polarella glacialis]|uniref:Uncharacterized protein n=1 Tax=Polarella glacialis TaxID=89957 RepID=A0A813DS51_POLGL|nr:unnamed protein product [Polarella glacialis]